jgi:hypothetical protein
LKRDQVEFLRIYIPDICKGKYPDLC